ncbi:DUF6894 family protein [Bradyrhizobium erythrophlei]|uniref:DUF6894 family protein n=1 Tax=Bradyrhizobium erythrophlei TaxID=1437360 RepID=UPI003CC8067A
MERRFSLRVGQEELGRVPDARFYFYKHINGQTLPDRRGTTLRNNSEACAHAVRCTPLTLSKLARSGKSTYHAWQVSDGQRTIYVVRGKVVIEKR